MKAMQRKQERTRDTTYVEHKSRDLNTQADSSQVVSKGRMCERGQAVHRELLLLNNGLGIREMKIGMS
jgi:hypothetical protein